MTDDAGSEREIRDGDGAVSADDSAAGAGADTDDSDPTSTETEPHLGLDRPSAPETRTELDSSEIATDSEPPFPVEVYPDREVIVEFDPGLTFECVEDCTWCCHHGVLLYDRDLLELAQRANLSETTTQFRGEPFVTREAKDREEHVAEDGQACAFLREDGLCSLHLEQDWKPTRCSVFPLGVWLEDDGLHVDVRDSAHDHCEGLGVSERRVVDNLEAFLPELLWDLENPDSDRVL